MADTHRDDDTLEIESPPPLPMGERVASRSVIRNDGTCNGHDIGAVPVQRGEVGAVRAIGTFLQQFYIYAVEFTASGLQVGMRAKELCTLDHLPSEVLALLGERAVGLETLR